MWDLAKIIVFLLAMLVGFPLLVVCSANRRSDLDRQRQEDCVRRHGGVVVPAHEGWTCAYPNRPENEGADRP